MSQQQYYNSKSISQLRNRSKYTPSMEQITSQSPISKTKICKEQQLQDTNESLVDQTEDHNIQKILIPPSYKLRSKQRNTQNTQSIQEINDFVYTVDGVDYDQHGNIMSPEFDLGIDGAFNDFSLLIGTFINRGNLRDGFVGLAVKSLEKKDLESLMFGVKKTLSMSYWKKNMMWLG